MDDFKIYILNFKAEGVNLAALHQYLTDSVDVLGFWNYIPLVYCLKSNLTAAQLQPKFKPFFPFGFMIGELNQFNLNGALTPAEQWSWFYSKPQPRTGYPIPSLFQLARPPY